METNARYMTVGIAVMAIVAAIFGFVYWLNNNVELGARALYRVRFENNVSGLLIGAAVQFNGIRVGEVASLQLDKDDPRGSSPRSQWTAPRRCERTPGSA